MKKTLSVLLFLALLVSMHSAAFAAELIDVKPIVSGSVVSVEILADTAMTYTYYKVPGQARAVVDIAETDPEKVDPLIVVNKGAVASISVDKAELSGMVVSRIIFNLATESDISVTASTDRKKLTVVFGGSVPPPVNTEPVQESKPEPEAKEEAPTLPSAKADLPGTPPTAGTPPEDDPLGLDEPAAKPAPEVAKSVLSAAATASIESAAPQPAKVAPRLSKLEPVVPVSSPSANSSALAIAEIAVGSSYIEVRTTRPVSDYKLLKLSSPQRLVIDIPGEKINQKPKSYTINRFGISKVRVGISPKNVRVVFDSAKEGFPVYNVTNSEDGLRVNFK
jgi:hypothetical protein